MQTLQSAQPHSAVYPLRPLHIGICITLEDSNCLGVRYLSLVRLKHVIRTVCAIFAISSGLLVHTVTAVITVITVGKVRRVTIFSRFSTIYSVRAVRAVCAVRPNSKVLAISFISETCIFNTIQTVSIINVIL